MDGQIQETAPGERAATIGGSIMARSCTGRSQESATGGGAATFGGSMMERSYTDMEAATERWLRYSEAL
jgi:hypothetical protein